MVGSGEDLIALLGYSDEVPVVGEQRVVRAQVTLLGMWVRRVYGVYAARVLRQTRRGR